ncbi:biosynthetic-type acetolactate synthase large subunit [Fusobacterium sp.]|uniref:biosynthetic-type acetolactate synthase large subunit n=1 Tax=Fusobacterium sp. TaxID=68766 RepID=UPI00261D63D7|nr:biosynthetic-type acetolactate synthase large subunit [Fusobacterium sp.]
MEKEKINGARVLLECLYRLGVKDIFGYPGGSVIPIYDELYSFSKINHYLARHEQGASHEADGYARASGKVGVCIATSGPGATNLVTGIMTAYMDSIPLLAITGQVNRSMLGKDSFQETDIVNITLPITKTNYQVMSIEDLPRIVKEAYHIAKSGRPGPVLIDIPRDIQLEEIEKERFEELYVENLNLESYKKGYVENLKYLEKALKMIKESKKPLIISGAGVIHSKAVNEFREFVNKTQIPVTSTLLGLGAFPGDEKLFLGMLGMHGTAPANLATLEADLIIGMGFRFDDRITGNINKFCPNAKIIHIDIDPSEIEKNIRVDVPIVSDLKKVLKLLNEKKIEVGNIKEWTNKLENLKEKYSLIIPDKKGVLTPQKVLKNIDKIIKGDAIVTTDVGQHQMWSALHLTFKNHSLISSGGGGTMGFGLPSAIGAQVACPNKKVLAIVGDGGIQMNIQELMLLKKYNLPVKVFIMNNFYLGMVRQWQELFHEKRYSSVNLDDNPDFMLLAQAYGIKGVTLKNEMDLKKLKEIIESDESVLVNCIVDSEENVYPMIPAGKSVEDMMGMRGVKDYDENI